MRLPEQKLYDWLVRKVGHRALLERVENEVKRDTPDLYFTARSTVASTNRPLSGWIELKVLDAFPAKATTTIKLPKWTNGQRHWALRHRAHGGHTWLVVQVGDEVFVHNAADAASNDWTQEQWRSFAFVLPKRTCSAGDVLEALREVVV